MRWCGLKAWKLDLLKFYAPVPHRFFLIQGDMFRAMPADAHKKIPRTKQLQFSSNGDVDDVDEELLLRVER